MQDDRLAVVMASVGRAPILHETAISVLRQRLLPGHIVVSVPTEDDVLPETRALPRVSVDPDRASRPVRSRDDGPPAAGDRPGLAAAAGLFTDHEPVCLWRKGNYLSWRNVARQVSRSLLLNAALALAPSQKALLLGLLSRNCRALSSILRGHIAPEDVTQV